MQYTNYFTAKEIEYTNYHKYKDEREYTENCAWTAKFCKLLLKIHGIF